MKRQLVLVTITGPDQNEITSALMKVLDKNKTELKDMGQVVTHGLLSLSLVLDIGKQDANSHPALKDLLVETQKLGMNLDFKVIQTEISTKPTLEKYILSCVSSDQITAKFVGDITELLGSHHITIQRIDNIVQEGFKTLDITALAQKAINWEKVNIELMSITNEHKIDAALIRDNIFRSNKRMIVFDMDSTLIQAEVIDEMAKVHGIGDKVKLITERAMNGEINFDESLRERVALLKGLPLAKLQEIYEKIQITPGAEKLIKTLQDLGFKTAIISGGFRFFAEKFRQRLGIDYAYANELELDGNFLSGRVKGQIINAQQKANILELIARQEHINLEQVVAVGDGANDLPMLARAGLGIAFHAKEKVKKETRHQVSHGPMNTILYFLGIPGNHLQ